MGIGDWFRNLFQVSREQAPPRVPPTAPPRAEVEARLHASNVPGAALAWVEDGAVAWVAGYGRTRFRGSAEHVTGATIFQAASLSKPVTALAILALVQEGRLDLDVDVRELVAHPIPHHPVLAHQTTEDLRPITPRLLLQHRGGIVGRGTTPADATSFMDATRGGGSLRYARGRGVHLPSLEDSWLGHAGRHGVIVTYPPGTRASYSGAGYLVLQHLIERVTGTSFVTHMDAFLPTLGAKGATFELDPPPHLPFARGHDARGRELPGGSELVPWGAAGGLFVTAASMAEILATMVRRDGAPLEPDLLDLMVRQRLGTYVRRKDGLTTIVHGGDNGGYRASFTGIVERRVGAVVLTNGRAKDGVELRKHLAARVMERAEG